MAKRPVVRVVGIWGKREDVEDHKEDVRVFKECCIVGWGTVRGILGSSGCSNFVFGINNSQVVMLLAVVRPTLEYESVVWEANKTQAAALESVMLGGAKRILGCSSKTCNEAVRGDIWA